MSQASVKKNINNIFDARKQSNFKETLREWNDNEQKSLDDNRKVN